jgi:sec-independent protein translocase protein TatA
MLKQNSHLIFIGLIVIVLFGAKKLPEASRSLGRSLRIFKSEMKEMKNDDIDETPKNDGSVEK